MIKIYSIKSFGLLLLLLFVGLGLNAQNVTISGSVVDGNDNALLQGVSVFVVGTQSGTLTDENGKFSLVVPKADQYAIQFRYVDFPSDTTVILISQPGKDSYVLDFRSSPKEVEFDPITVTATLHTENISKLTNSMDVISQKKVDIQISSDIKDALQQNSGVDIIDGQPSIRGSSGYAYGVGSRVLLMLDGLPLLSPDASIAQFDIVPTDNIAQIEVMKGASSVLYGSAAMGGVINVIMADAPAEPKTSIRMRGAAYGSPADKRLDWDGKSSAKNAGINVFHSRRIGRNDLTAMVDFWRDSGWKYATPSTQGRVQVLTKFRPKGIEGLTWGVNGSARFDSSRTFLFWDSYTPDDTLITFGGDTIFNALGAFAGTNSTRAQFNTRFTADPFFKYLTAKNRLHNYRGRIMRTTNANNTGQSNFNWMFYNDYQYSMSLLDDRISWVSGATASFNYIRGDSVYKGSHRAINTAVYTQFDARISSKFNATLGARFDNWNVDDSINARAPIFRAGLNYEFFKGSNIRASFGQAFRNPSITERYTNTFASGFQILPNPDLKVEKGFSAEIGYRQGFGFGKQGRSVIGYLDLAGFVMDYNNMIEFGIKDPDTFRIDPSPAFIAKNYSHARTSGIEISGLVQVTHDKFRFDVNGGVTYINPVNLNPGVDSLQVDLLNTIGPQSQPFTGEAFGMLLAMISPPDAPFHRTDNPRTLKYRSKWINRCSATMGYGRFNLTCNYRFKSPVTAIDQYLYVAIPGAADWVHSHPKGFSIYDFIVSTQVSHALSVSVSAENAFNREWATLPGIIGEQRNFNLQMKYVF